MNDLGKAWRITEQEHKAMLAEIDRQRTRAERLRLELEKIGWMDEFLDADGARAMMNIARDAMNTDEELAAKASTSALTSTEQKAAP